MIGNVINKVRYSVLSPTPLQKYDIPFKFWDASQISLRLTSDDGTETSVDVLDYTVSTPGDTGEISFDGGYVFPANTAILTIFRTITIEQLTDYRNGDVLDAEVLEKSFDTTIAMIQQVNERLDRTVRIPISDPSVVLEMPSALIRANMLLGFDAAGNIIPILTSDIEQKLSQALAAENSVLGMYNDPGMVAVRTDMADPSTSKIQKVANNKINIDTVATSIADVNAVGGNIVKVVAVANNETNINAVKSNESNINAVVANESNINTVAGINLDVSKVAAINTAVSTVASIDSDVSDVASIKVDVSKVATIDAAVSSVANIDGAVTDVASIKTDVSNVALIKTDVSAVANIKNAVSAVAANETNINAVKTNESNINAVAGNKANIDAVAGNEININKVATIDANVTTVAGINNEVSTVATNVQAVKDAADNMQAIIDAPSEASAAATARGLAEDARDRAEEWAENPEDTEVITGQYSALHWSEKAKAYAQSAQAADAAANKQLTYNNVLYEYSLNQASRAGHIAISFTEVI